MYKIAVKRYLQLIMTILLIVFSVIFVLDPYMLFHKKWFDEQRIYNNLRIQNYGIIKYTDFDSIIMGTSMLQNVSAKEASEKLGSRFVNLSISGSNFYERFKMLNFALKKKKLKHIIFSLDYKFAKSQEIMNSFPANLYEKESIYSKFQIYMTNKALECIFLNFKGDMINYNLDRPTAWDNRHWHIRRFGGFDNWVKYHEVDNQIQGAFKQMVAQNITGDEEYKAYKQVIDNEIFPLLLHKQVDYSIIIPPYSVLWWKKRKELLDEYFEVYAYLIKKTADLPNVKIYWFYDDNFASDITKYKDLIHYHSEHHSKEINAIKNNSNVINEKNYLRKFSSFKKKIMNFNFEKYLRKVPQQYYQK